MRKIVFTLSIVSLVAMGTFYPIIVGDSKFLPSKNDSFDFLEHKDEIKNFLNTNDLKVMPFVVYNVPSSGKINFTDNRVGPLEITFVVNNLFKKVTFYKPRYMRTVSRGGGMSTDFSFFYLGMTKSDGRDNQLVANSLLWPKCNLKCVWERAIEKGANKNSVAEIHYKHNEILFFIREKMNKFKFRIEL